MLVMRALSVCLIVTLVMRALSVCLIVMLMMRTLSVLFDCYVGDTRFLCFV